MTPTPRRRFLNQVLNELKYAVTLLLSARTPSIGGQIPMSCGNVNQVPRAPDMGKGAVISFAFSLSPLQAYTDERIILLDLFIALVKDSSQIGFHPAKCLI